MRRRLPIEEQNILVTGATDGIGRETAAQLARLGASVIVHGRSEEKAEKVAHEIRERTGNRKVSVVEADFRSLEEIRIMANDLHTRFGRLDVLVNNAGVVMKERMITRDGFETTFQVNYLSPFYLTNLLLDLMDRPEETRIIVVASQAHHGAYIEFDNLQGERLFDPFEAYDMSKLANIMFTYELTRRLQGTHVTANCLHPGVIDTKLLRAGYGGGGGGSPERGARTSVYLATSNDVTGVSGRYFIDCKQADSSDESHDQSRAKMLWDTTLHLIDRWLDKEHGTPRKERRQGERRPEART